MTVRILLHEHYSSRPPGTAPPALRQAGRAMVDAARRGLAALPGVTIVPAPTSARPDGAFRRGLARADAALVIAPEARGLLARLAGVVEGSRATPLGPGPVAARIAGDKLKTARLLARAGIATPPTRAVGRGAAGRRALGRMPLPLVVKPRNGCGAEGVEVVRRVTGIAAALARARHAAAGGGVVVQPYVKGTPVSVTLLVRRGARGRGAAVLGVGRQRIAGRRRLRYLGGEVPIDGAAATAAARLARRAVEALAAAAGDLRGPVGVDLVLGRDGPLAIEINPRLTASWIGLVRLAPPGLGRLLLDAARGRRLPRRVRLEGRCVFSAGGRVTMLRARVPSATQRGGRRRPRR